MPRRESQTLQEIILSALHPPYFFIIEPIIISLIILQYQQQIVPENFEMWLKKMIYKEQPIQDQLQGDSKNKMLQEEDSEEVPSCPLIDHTPDTRYAQFITLLQHTSMIFPLTALHEDETIFLEETRILHAKMTEGQEHQWQEIDLLLSDRQAIITPNIVQPFGKKISNYFCLSYGWVEKCQMLQSKNRKQQQRMRILMKDGREIYIKSVMGDIVSKACEIINKFSCPAGINKLYAFRFGATHSKLEKERKGWSIFDMKKELERQGLKTEGEDAMLLKFLDNRTGQMSPTYPEWLVVPSKISDSELKKCANFRTKERLPVLTYLVEYSSKKFSLLFRCSQNKVGILSARSTEDQTMMSYIGDLTGESLKNKNPKKNCKIYDARGYYAALGNMFAGKGYERPEFYQNCEIQWLNIPNIHAVRQSYATMMNHKGEAQDYLKLCSESGWYDYLYLIIAGAKSVARDLLSGVNVVVHCSDGWDRTSQLCALAQLIIDPYFRTIEGLAVLIEKDWRHFGHKFRQRTGQYHPTTYHPQERSPIFIQFLDCIFQLLNQFPLSFEYNSRLLHFLATNVDSHVFGSFLTNNCQEAKSLKIEEHTVSIWSHILENRGIFENPYYNSQIEEFWLDVSTQAKNVRIWKSLFLGDGVANNIQYHFMRQAIQINKTLRTQYYKNEQNLRQMKEKLASLKH